MLTAFGFISKIDVFGAEVGLKYEGKNKYRSRLGGFSSLIVGCLISALFYQQFYQIFNRVNPNVIYEQTYVQMPGKYNLTKNQFSFMIGLQDQNDNPVIDEDIFTIEAQFAYKVQTIINNTTAYNFVVNKIEIGPCAADDFQMADVQSYFMSQPYQKYYCLKNQNELYLEGQFDQNFFSVLTFKIIECTDKPNCKPPMIRQQFIKSSYAQIFYTDRIVETQNFEKPFKNVGKTQYYNIFYDFLLNSNFIFSNTHIQDDTGLIVESLTSQTQLQFINDRYQLQSKTGSEFFSLAVYLDKNKENSYYRSYKKIPEVFSQLGGTFQVLFFMGCILIKPYNQLKLKNRLHKDIFSVENQNLNKKQAPQKQVKKKSILVQSKNTQNTVQNIINKSQMDSIVEGNLSDQEEQKFGFIRKIKEFLGIVPQYVKQQYQEIENMRSIKTIINTQIQFILLQNLFYQIDFSKIQFSNQRSQGLESKSKILLESCVKENNLLNSMNYYKFQKNQSFSNLKSLNINDFNIKNDKLADIGDKSLSKQNEEEITTFINKQNSPILKGTSCSGNYDTHSKILNDKAKKPQIFEERQEKSKSEIDIESQSPSVQDVESYIKIFNSIKILNQNQFQNSADQLNIKQKNNNQSFLSEQQNQ
ncbi:hypothetical protein ABPG73_019418 [Tetrahymena malaccensis]